MVYVNKVNFLYFAGEGGKCKSKQKFSCVIENEKNSYAFLFFESAVKFPIFIGEKTSKTFPNQKI